MPRPLRLLRRHRRGPKGPHTTSGGSAPPLADGPSPAVTAARARAHGPPTSGTAPGSTPASWPPDGRPVSGRRRLGRPWRGRPPLGRQTSPAPSSGALRASSPAAPPGRPPTVSAFSSSSSLSASHSARAWANSSVRPPCSRTNSHNSCGVCTSTLSSIFRIWSMKPFSSSLWSIFFLSRSARRQWVWESFDFSEMSTRPLPSRTFRASSWRCEKRCLRR